MGTISVNPVCASHMPVIQLVRYVQPKFTNCLGCNKAAIIYIEGNTLADKEVFTMIRETIKRLREDYRVPLTY